MLSNLFGILKCINVFYKLQKVQKVIDMRDHHITTSEKLLYSHNFSFTH